MAQAESARGIEDFLALERAAETSMAFDLPDLYHHVVVELVVKAVKELDCSVRTVCFPVKSLVQRRVIIDLQACVSGHQDSWSQPLDDLWLVP